LNYEGVSSLALSCLGQEFFYLRKNFRNQPALPVLQAVEEIVMQHAGIEGFAGHN